MTKQRLAEIMNEIDEGRNDIANMGVSLLLNVTENGRLMTIGIATPIDVMVMAISMVRKIASDFDKDIDSLLEFIGNTIKLGEAMGMFKGED